MKLAVTSQGPDKDSLVDPRFGRANYFVLYDTKTKQFSAVDNDRNLNAVQGAGIQAARHMVNLGVDVVITGHTGPKAFTTLQGGHVKVFTGANGTAIQAIEQFKAGQLTQVDNADVQGHWV